MNTLHTMQTDRLILRHWKETDAESLYDFAKDPRVGLPAGWPPHRSVEESREIIKNVLCSPECYAICLREDGIPIGTIELKRKGSTDMTDRDDECELGYCLHPAFWGRGYMPEAGREVLRHAFEELGMRAVWCGYYEGNDKSRRVQEKLGFSYHHRCDEVPVPRLHEIRIGFTNLLTKEDWNRQQENIEKQRMS